jgi:hypothetical protein
MLGLLCESNGIFNRKVLNLAKFILCILFNFILLFIIKMTLVTLPGGPGDWLKW